MMDCIADLIQICNWLYLVGTLELFLVKIKVSTQSPHSKQ